MGVRLGGLLNVAYQFTPSHKIQFKNFLTRDTDNETRFFEGFNSDFESNIRNSRLRWTERSIYSAQVEGEHLFCGVGNSIFWWQMSFSQAKRDEPDLRENLFQQIRDDGFRWLNDSQSAFRMFNDMDDDIVSPSVAWRKPFYAGPVTGSFKVGGQFTFRERDFFSRRFRLNVVDRRTVDLFERPNVLFRTENIRTNGFEITEETRSTDRYRADRDVFASFGMVDLAFGSRWRLIGGVRVEQVDQLVTTFDPFNPNQNRQESEFKETNPLPSLNVIYSLTPRSNLRFGFSQTLSRPDFRELALFDFRDVTGGRAAIGNPDLVQTKIRNWDARWEYFPGGNQLLAASFFFKDFDDPIERTVQPTVGLRTSFDNAESARNLGLELEFRRNLQFLHDGLRELSLGANLTFVDSEIDLTNSQRNVLTSRRRPMEGQSRYIYNLVFEWARPVWRSTTRLFVKQLLVPQQRRGSQPAPQHCSGRHHDDRRRL